MGSTRWSWLAPLSLGLAGCATMGGAPGRLTALETEAGRCDDFTDFELRASEVLDEVLRSSREVLDATAQVARARQACARRVMRVLLILRERRGAEAAQQQLDAMAMALSSKAFNDVTREASTDPSLRAMVALASATAATTRTNQARTGAESAAIEGLRVEAPSGPEPSEGLDAVTAKVQVRHCSELGPDAELTCLGELSAHVIGSNEREALTEAARGAARRKIEALRIVPPAQRGAALARLSERLEALEVDEPSVKAQLERSRVAAWPEVVAAQRSGRLEDAAVRAEPFKLLPSSRAEVEQLESAAAERQLERAKAAGEKRWAAAFHRRLAARFGAPAAGWPDVAHQWDITRFQCQHGPGELPSASGMGLRLVATCKKTKRASEGPQQKDPAMKTFENERSLEWEDIEGTLFVSCAGRVLSFRVMSRDLALESGDSGGLGAAAQSALGVELQKVISRAAPECRAARAELVERDCAALETVSPLENEEKFTQHALALQQWPACFTRWLDATLGLEPPAVHEGAQKPR